MHPLRSFAGSFDRLFAFVALSAVISSLVFVIRQSVTASWFSSQKGVLFSMKLDSVKYGNYFKSDMRHENNDGS